MNDPNAMTVYRFIETYMQANGFAPSVRNIADGCFMSRSNVIRYLDKLEAWGYITREPGQARSIALLRTPE